MSILYDPNSIIPNIDNLKKPTDSDMFEAGFKDPRAVENLKYIMKDLLDGDISLQKREEYKYLNFDQIKIAIEWLMANNFDDGFLDSLISNPWALMFKSKPPTPEEFLEYKYIGATSENIWWPVKKNFIEFMDPLAPYRTAIWNCSIGSGKSTVTMLILLYVACCFALMRDPWKYFSKSHSSVFIMALCAVTKDKAKEIYYEPIRQLIESSTFWNYCKTHQEMINEDKHLRESDIVESVPYTFSAGTALMQTGNNLSWKDCASDSNIMGLNILCGSMTEINFFIEAGKGWTTEKVFKFFSKLRARITNRFSNNYYARFILDSSPSELSDPIQNWIYYDAPENKENFIWRGARWDNFPTEFPYYLQVTNPKTFEEKVEKIKADDNCFYIFKGGDGKPPKVFEVKEEALQEFEIADLVECPKIQVTDTGTVNYLNMAKEDPINFLKDHAGMPAGQPDRLFYRDEWIEGCFQNNLKNKYGAIVALAEQEPEHLIWNQVEHDFFYRVMNRNYYYYEPELPRVVSVDQSKSRDCTCISMSHVEVDPKRIDPHTSRPMVVYITDFTIVLVPKGGHINLDAIKYFILDLRNLGGLNIRFASLDGYQSDPTMQAWKRAGINSVYVSVDRDSEPYYTYYDIVIHNRWFCGKNIFVKNNMKSVHEVRRKTTGSVKIDHFEGPLNYEWSEGDWFTCTAGINAKDSLDAITANVWLLNLHADEFIASKKWDPDDDIQRTYESVKKKHLDYMKANNLYLV